MLAAPIPKIIGSENEPPLVEDMEVAPTAIFKTPIKDSMSKSPSPHHSGVKTLPKGGMEAPSVSGLGNPNRSNGAQPPEPSHQKKRRKI